MISVAVKITRMEARRRSKKYASVGTFDSSVAIHSEVPGEDACHAGYGMVQYLLLCSTYPAPTRRRAHIFFEKPCRVGEKAVGELPSGTNPTCGG